jgi:dihydropteroate synthase
VAAGASMVNDISGGYFDDDLIRTVGHLKVPYVCMHVKGSAETMHKSPTYESVTKEVLDYLISRVENCRAAGINDIIIDPGFGFAKNPSHNFRLLKDLSVFKIIDKPLMAGLSRKSTVYKTLGTSVEEALNGTTVLQTIALLNGANILRVHDVKEAVEAVKLVAAYRAS